MPRHVRFYRLPFFHSKPVSLLIPSLAESFAFTSVPFLPIRLCRIISISEIEKSGSTYALHVSPDKSALWPGSKRLINLAATARFLGVHGNPWDSSISCCSLFSLPFAIRGPFFLPSSRRLTNQLAIDGSFGATGTFARWKNCPWEVLI